MTTNEAAPDETAIRRTATTGAVQRTAIVTGGSRGFGLEVTRVLTGRGWKVVIDGRNRRDLERAADETGAVAVAGDVTDAANRRELAATARRLTGRIDLVVNNAGGLGPSPLPALADVAVRDLTALFEVNVAAPLALAQVAMADLRAAGGAVLNVTSDAAVEAYAGWGAYGATKAALEQLSAVLAAEEPGVRVWWLDPGDMRTDMHQLAFPGQDITDRPLPAEAAAAVTVLVDHRPPSGRFRAADLIGGLSPAAGTVRP